MKNQQKQIVVKRAKDAKIVESQTCGSISEVLTGLDYPHCSIAVVNNIGITVGHFHETFDEIYWLEKGEISVLLYNPELEKKWTEKLSVGDVLVISKNVHHKVTKASTKNKLIAISVPAWKAEDEKISDLK